MQQTLDRILLDLHDNLSTRLFDTFGTTNPVQRARMIEVQRQLEYIIDQGVDEIRDEIVKDMTLSARYASEGRLKAAQVYLYDTRPDLLPQIPLAFSTVNEDAVRAVLARTFTDQKIFSDRIWDIRRYTQNVIAETLTKGVAEGKSAYQLSRELEAFLAMTEDEAAAFNRVWAEAHTPEWKEAWKTRSRLKYNAERLARTEINNAYREGAVQSARRTPWVKGLKWNLSGSHPKPDICDEWATQDIDGLGPGVYKWENVPLDHPNGLCHLTDVLVEKSELAGMSFDMAA
jgi:hypothetical protein